MALEVAGAGPVAELVLARPGQRNAMDEAMVAGLFAALERLRADDEVGAVVLRGAGAGFCAGSDLKMLAAMDAAARSRFEADCGRLAREMVGYPKPLVAAVSGFAMGGGCTLAAACDVVVSAPDARWSLPEVPAGLFPAWGLAPVAARVGRAAARRLCFGLDVVAGAEAKALGLVDQLAADPAAEAVALATRLAALPRAQLAAVKAYFAAPRHGDEADGEANRLFLAACETEAARATFARFG